MKLRECFTLRTVRKKILMATKLAGIVLVVSYVASTRLPLAPDAAFWVWLCFVTVVVLAVDHWMGRCISRPVDALGAAARKMARLDFSAPCRVQTKDEFGELSRNLNTMAQNLQQALAQLQDANARLEQDVEREKHLLAERKELVDSLSHEMKTPLGVIRAYAEGLQDEPDAARRQKYAEVIVDETERMNRLITTLLDLSALENGAARLRPERFDFVELPERPVCVQADKARMEQVLNNLILNAKKNVRPGGVLRLSLREQDGALHFSVFDEGPPIPESDLPKIWSKFYRDKNARYSGSGLGLAIVAQVLSMQGLPYGAANRPGGVEFYFTIPVAS